MGGRKRRDGARVLLVQMTQKGEKGKCGQRG